ncbi:MAG TPA: DUF3048 domain-containing protein [Anaerolineaceae bacterium]
MLKRTIFSLIILVTLAACGPTVTPTPTLSPTQTIPAVPTATTTSVPTQTPLPSVTPSLGPATATPAPTFPAAGYGPTNFPSGVDPLTGLQISNPDLLNRRPIVIKVENLPRNGRPQFGLSLADIVYEYYTEAGGTRFASVFYGQDAQEVGPVRSARWFDFNVVQMYKGVFAFGYAYADLYSALLNSDFYNRLLVEGTGSSPALFRVQPNGPNYLMVNTLELPAVIKNKKIDNSKQNLDGMSFNTTVPAGGNPVKQVYVRYSGAIYNRWDYDPTSNQYLRFEDAADDPNRNNEVYTQLTDQLTSKSITADNVVMVFVDHKYVTKTATTEVFNMNLIGEGKAYVARDGQLFQVKWKRAKQSDVMAFVNADGSPFALKPGQTWVEVLGTSSTVTDLKNGAYKFTWLIP